MSKSTKLGIFGKSIAGLGIVTAVGAGAVAVNNNNTETAKSAPADHQDAKQDLSSITDRVNKADKEKKAEELKKSAEDAARAKAEAVQAKSQGAAKATVSEAKDHTVEVQTGDTLWGIASQNGVTMDELMDANPNLGTVIHPGDKVIIPSEDGAKAETPKAEVETPNTDVETPNTDVENPDNGGFTGPDGTTNGGHTGSQVNPDTNDNTGGNTDNNTGGNTGDNSDNSADLAAKEQAAKDSADALNNALAAVTDANNAAANAQASLDSANNSAAAAKDEAARAQAEADQAQSIANSKDAAKDDAAAAAQAAQEAVDAAMSEGVKEAIDAAQAALAEAQAAAAEAQAAADAAVNAANEALRIANDKNATVAEAQAAADAAAQAAAEVAAKAQAAQEAAAAAQAAANAANQAYEDAKNAADRAEDANNNAKNEAEIITINVTVSVDEAGNKIAPDNMAPSEAYTFVSESTTTSDRETGVPGQIERTVTTTRVYHKSQAVTNDVTVNVDEAGNEITPSAEYVKVSESTETSTNRAENGDMVTTNTTTVVWHKISHSDIVKNVDEAGNEITPSDEYKLISSDSSTETNENGDTVTTITNVYHKIVTTTNEVVKNIDEAGNEITPSDEYIQVGETVVEETREVAENGDVTITISRTTTFHKIQNSDKNVTVNVDEAGNEITPDSSYKLVSTSSETSTEKLPNGDTVTTVTTTNVYHKIANTDVHETHNVDEAGNEISSTDGWVKVGENELKPVVTTAENGDTTTTYVTNVVWHKPSQIGDTDFSDRLIDNEADNGYTIISGNPDLRYYEVSKTETHKVNVQENGDYTLETVTYYTLTDAGFQRYLNDQMAAALSDTKAQLWEMFPEVAKELESKGNSLGVRAMTPEEQAAHDADAKAAAENCAENGKLSHSNYGDMGQIIARGGYFLDEDEDPNSPAVARRMIESAIDAYMQELEALKVFLETGKTIGEYGHLLAIISMQECYTDYAIDGSKGYIATNWM